MNESFDQRIWNMCKKDKRFEADQLEFSICQNILTHNLGYEHGSLLNSFGINITKSIKQLWNVQEKARIKLRPLQAKYRRKREEWAEKASQDGYNDDDGFILESDEPVAGGSKLKSYDPGAHY